MEESSRHILEPVCSSSDDEFDGVRVPLSNIRKRMTQEEESVDDHRYETLDFPSLPELNDDNEVHEGVNEVSVEMSLSLGRIEELEKTVDEVIDPTPKLCRPLQRLGDDVIPSTFDETSAITYSALSSGVVSIPEEEDVNISILDVNDEDATGDTGVGSGGNKLSLDMSHTQMKEVSRKYGMSQMEVITHTHLSHEEEDGVVRDGLEEVEDIISVENDHEVVTHTHLSREEEEVRDGSGKEENTIRGGNEVVTLSDEQLELVPVDVYSPLQEEDIDTIPDSQPVASYCEDVGGAPGWLLGKEQAFHIKNILAKERKVLTIRKRLQPLRMKPVETPKVNLLSPSGRPMRNVRSTYQRGISINENEEKEERRSRGSRRITSERPHKKRKSISIFGGIVFLLTGLDVDERRRLTCIITENGGVVMEDIPHDEECFHNGEKWMLLSSGPKRTMKYLFAMCLSIYTVHISWVEMCVWRRSRLSVDMFLLPLMQDDGTGEYVLWESPSTNTSPRPLECRVFYGQRVAFGNKKSRVYSDVLRFSGADVVALSSSPTFLLCDGLPSSSAKRKNEYRLDGFTTGKQCISPTECTFNGIITAKLL